MMPIKKIGIILNKDVYMNVGGIVWESWVGQLIDFNFLPTRN